MATCRAATVVQHGATTSAARECHRASCHAVAYLAGDLLLLQPAVALQLLVQVAACAGSDVVLCKARRRLEACTRQLSGRPAQKHIGVMLCSDARIARCCRLYGGRQFWGARLQSAINSPSTTQFISGATSKVAPTANSWTRYTCLLSSKAPYRAIMCSWCSVLWIWISRATCISHTALALQVVLDKRSGSGLPANSSPSCQLRIGWRHAQLAKRLVYGSAQRRP